MAIQHVGRYTGKQVNVVNFEPDDTSTDALGRLRVAEANTVAGYSFEYGLAPLVFSTKTSGGGTVTNTPTTPSAKLNVGTTSGDEAIIQTRRHIKYTPGRGYFINLSGVFGAAKTNVRKRWGYFAEDDGIFFEQTSAGLGVVIRSSVSGSPVDTKFMQTRAQSSQCWNIDPMDGTGPSGVTLDTTKHNLYVIDFTWHGAGRIRFGVLIGGRTLMFHEYAGGNVNTTPWMQGPSRPVRVEITNTGTAGSSTSIDFVCFAAQRESNDRPFPTHPFGASRGRSAVTVGASYVPLISIQPKLLFNTSLPNRIQIVPEEISIKCGAVDIYVAVFLNPALTGASFVSADSNSATNYDITASAISGGTKIKELLVTANGNFEMDAGAARDNFGLDMWTLGLDIAGSTADIISVAALSTGGNSSTFAAINWHEFH